MRRLLAAFSLLLALAVAACAVVPEPVAVHERVEERGGWVTGHYGDYGRWVPGHYR